MSGGGAEPTGFLYPFIEAEEHDAGALLTELAASARAKLAHSAALRASTREASAGVLDRAAEAVAAALGSGGRLFTFGNGGSSTDAEGAAELFRSPPRGRPLPALSLVDDRAVLTALANDVGFDLVFSRQLIAHARQGDVALGLSTSGSSENVLRALEQAARQELVTVGLSGDDGGAMAGSDAVAHSLVVRSDSVHRIQETQDELVMELWSRVQRHLGGFGGHGRPPCGADVDVDDEEEPRD